MGPHNFLTLVGCVIAATPFIGVYNYLSSDASDPGLFASLDLPKVANQCYCEMLALGVLEDTVPMIKTIKENASGDQDYCTTGFIEVNPEDIRERLVNFVTIVPDETFHIPEITEPGKVLNATEIDTEMTPEMVCTLLFNPKLEVPVRNLAKKPPHYLVPLGVFRAFDITTAILVLIAIWVVTWGRCSAAEGASLADVTWTVGLYMLLLWPMEMVCQFWFAGWSLDQITVILVTLGFLMLSAMRLERPTIPTAIFWSQTPDGQSRQEALTVLDKKQICGYLVLFTISYYCTEACWGTMFLLLLAHFGVVIFGAYGRMFLNLYRAWYNQEGVATRISVSEVAIHTMKLAAVTFIEYLSVPPLIFGALLRFNHVGTSDLVYERDALQLFIKATVALAICVAIALVIIGMKRRAISSPRILPASMLTGVICTFAQVGFACMGETPHYDWPGYWLSAFEGFPWPNLSLGGLLGYVLPW